MTAPTPTDPSDATRPPEDEAPAEATTPPAEPPSGETSADDEAPVEASAKPDEGDAAAAAESEVTAADDADETDAKDESRSGEATSPEDAEPEAAPAETPSSDAPGAEAGSKEDEPAATATAEGAEASTASGDGEGDDAGDAGKEGKAGDAPKSEAKPKPRKKRKKPRRVARPPKPKLDDAQKEEAREAARGRIVAKAKGNKDGVAAALDLLAAGRHVVFLGRFRRAQTHGLDERALRSLRDRWERVLEEEETRIGLRELLKQHGDFDENVSRRLREARGVHAMEDLAAPHLPVVAGRAMVARGHGLQPLAAAIRDAEPGSNLAELAPPFVKEGDEPATVDDALGGARDILAEEISLSVDLRARLRRLFHEEGVLSVGLRSERKGDAGRHKGLVGFEAPARKVPPMKLLGIRRGEKERVLVSTVEPPEEKALPILHEMAGPEDHPHIGFLRAAAEDGYRRILKPLLAQEIRAELKERADAHAMETFERNLRHRLLGPVGGARKVLGLRPDVTGGHRWCAVDEKGEVAGFGTLPHEGTAGKEACVAELGETLRTYEIEVVAVGSGGGRKPALEAARAAMKTSEATVDAVVVSDGGTHSLESQGPLSFDDRPDMPGELRGALSLARRFQDPLHELIGLEPKTLGLGPHMHDVHQGHLRRMLEEVAASCVARAGVDINQASRDLIAHLPGFDKRTADAFLAWRDEHGPLLSKPALAAVPGVGADVAEQGVGFARIPEAQDPRDRTQLHPELYTLVDQMAEQVGCDVPTLFQDADKRRAVQLDPLATDEVPIPALKYVLYQLVAGHEDERARWAQPIAPPEGITLETLQPGLLLEGRVIRVLPFGVFVDVGLGTDALIPNAHVGDHPGADVAAVAPLGATVRAHVIEVIPEKRRITLSMRSDRRGAGTPRGRGPGRGGGRGPRRDDRGGSRGPREGAGDARGGRGGGGGGGSGGGGRGRGRGGGRGRKAGKYDGGSIGDIFRGGGRGGRGGRGGDRKPRTISIGPDEGHENDDRPDENLSEEELLKRKLEQLKKKFGGS